MDSSKKAALVSFLASILILALKYAAYVQTGSMAVLSDALESIVNVIAAFTALMVMRAVAAPADEDHPYGHGKLEFFSATFEGGLITFAGLMIMREAWHAFTEGQVPHNLDVGILISVLAAFCNFILGIYLKTTGRRQKSEALIASGQHVLADVWSTAGTLIGLGLVLFTGLVWFDYLAAFLMGLHLCFSGYQIVRRSMGGLIDEVSPQTLTDLAFAFQENRQEGVIDIHLTKVIRSGRFHHIDCHLVVPEYWTILKTHALMETFEKAVVETYPFDGEINFHLDPCFQDYCSSCHVQDCPVRQRPFVTERIFTGQSLIQRPEKDQP